MVGFMVSLFPVTLFALIATMVVFLAKDRASTSTLNVAVILQCIIVAATYAVAIDTSRSGGMLVGVAIMYVIFTFIIPSMVMMNFILYATIFNSIVDGLKGRLKLLTAASLASYGIMTLAILYERQIFNWTERISTFGVFGWIAALLFFTIIILWILGAFVAHWWMFIYALKTTPEPVKKVWNIIAFCLPIVGSVIYLFVHLIKAFVKIKRG